MDDLRHDDQIQVSFSGDESPAQWPIRPVVPPQRSYHFASQPQGYPSQHNGSQHGEVLHTGGMYEDFDTTGLSLTGDVLLLEHQNPLPLEEQVIDPSLRNHSGTSEHSRTAIDPSQSAQHQPTVSTVRVPYAGASTPPSSPAWIDGTDRLNYRDSRFLALPTETPTKQPLKEGSDLRHVNQGTMCTKDAGAGEQRQWEWSQSPSEHAQAQYDADNFTPRYGVSAEDAVVDAGVVLDFLGQPEADGMVAPKDVNGIMNVYSLVYRMQ